MCEYNPVRAYIEHNNCKDATGQLLPSPITPATVNTVYEGSCVLQMAIQSNRMDVFKEAWAVGANPDKCAAQTFYSFLVGQCFTDPVFAQRYIDASANAGWFTRADQAQQLLEPAIIQSCSSGIEWALAKGARVTQHITNPAYQNQTHLQFAYNHYSKDWYRDERSQKAFRTLIKSGGCDANIDWPKVKPDAEAVLGGIRSEVCGS
jgi:hypothetical protein